MQIVMQFLPNFLLIFCRITAFFVVAPVFSSRGLPAQFKVGLSFFVTLLILLSMGQVTPISWDYEYVVSIFRELLIGLLLGFTAYLLFTVVQVAGSFVDLQLGFGIANVIDPMTGAQSPILGNFKFMIAMLLFLSVNGHHYMLMAIMRSYEWVPLSNELFSRIYTGDISEFLLRTFATMFLLAFQMSAPLVLALFLVDVALGILARTAPQFNVFVVGLPLKIIVGFIVLLIIVPSLLYLFNELFETVIESMYQLLDLIKP
jgi:flagellar biosynthetic protein FliR